MPASVHVPLDLVVVIPVSSSMQGLKITLLRDALRFLVQNLGERDRMGLVTFGSSGGGVPLVGMTTKTWTGWAKILNSIRPVGQKSLRADVVEGANVAMDLLMQRKSNNPIATILLISDSSTSDGESVDFVVSRAEAAKLVFLISRLFRADGGWWMAVLHMQRCRAGRPACTHPILSWLTSCVLRLARLELRFTLSV